MNQEPMSMEQSQAAEMQAQLKDRLMAVVSRRIREAQEARRSSGIEELWQDDEDQYNGFDDVARPVTRHEDTPRQKVPGARSTVFLNITKPKTDSACARVQEMLLPTDDKPWSYSPTPIPEVEDALKTQDTTPVMTADGQQVPKVAAAAALMADAKAGVEKLEKYVEDWLIEGSVYAEMRKVFRDAARIGTGVIKGPFPVARTEKRWSVQGGVAMLAIVEKIKPTSKRVDPRNLFPDPACGECIHDGSYIVEREFMTARQLRELAKAGKYDPKAIAECLREGPRRNARQQDNQLRDTPGDTARESDVFEIFHYYGDVPAEDLLAMGVKPEVIDPEHGEQDDEQSEGTDPETMLFLADIPACVTMINDRPIKASVNPLETGEFPFDVFTWEPVDGQIWGRGIPRKMKTAQAMLNAATRRMLENAGLSAGPNMVLMKGLVTPADGKYEVTSPKIWYFNPQNEAGVTDVRAAVAYLQVPSAQAELMNILQFALQMADELTNLPMIMQGQSNREGGASTETYKGMQLAFNSANAPLRVIAKQGDDQIFVPHLRRYYDWAMQDPEVPDEAKKDAQVLARGSTALLQREVMRDKLGEAFQLLGNPQTKLDPAKLTTEWLRAQGMNPEDVQYSEEEWQQLQEAQSQQQPDPALEAAKLRADAILQAAQIKAQADQQHMQFEIQESAKDRAIEVIKHDTDREIAQAKIEVARLQNMDNIKANLAAKAMDARSKAEEMQLKLSPSNPTNQGI